MSSMQSCGPLTLPSESLCSERFSSAVARVMCVCTRVCVVSIVWMTVRYINLNITVEVLRDWWGEHCQIVLWRLFLAVRSLLEGVYYNTRQIRCVRSIQGKQYHASHSISLHDLFQQHFAQNRKKRLAGTGVLTSTTRITFKHSARAMTANRKQTLIILYLYCWGVVPCTISLSTDHWYAPSEISWCWRHHSFIQTTATYMD